MIKTFLMFICLALVTLLNFEAVVLGEVNNSSDGSDQQILEFELSGFGDKGKRTWDVKGRSADIFSTSVGLNDITANIYGEEEDVEIIADTGTYDKIEGNVHLEDNVVITTETGAKLITDSLDWYQSKQQVVTEDEVNITKGNVKIIGKGIEAEPNLKKVKLNKDVRVDIKDADFSLNDQEPGDLKADDQKEPITITCDGSLNVDYEKQIAIFHDNVKVVHTQGEMYADKMVVSFDTEGKQIKKVESFGNVKIVNGENISYSQEAVYTAGDKKVILTGRPRLVIYSGSSMNFME